MGLLRAHGLETNDPGQYVRAIKRLLDQGDLTAGEWSATRSEALLAGIREQDMNLANAVAFNFVAREKLIGRWFSESKAESLNTARLGLRVDFNDVAEDVRESLSFYRWLRRVSDSPANGAILGRRTKIGPNEICLLEVDAKLKIIHVENGKGSGLPNSLTFSATERLDHSVEPPALPACPNHKLHAIGHLTLTSERLAFTSQFKTFSIPWPEVDVVNVFRNAIHFQRGEPPLIRYISMSEGDTMATALLSDCLIAKLGCRC